MAEKLSADTTRMLRHLVASIAFRAGRALRDAPPGFENTRPIEGAMSAGELVLHMTNVTAFAIATVSGKERIRHEALSWPEEVDRFYTSLLRLDEHLAEGAVLEEGLDLKLLQGPLADALTHVGQLHTLRRLAGYPVPPTNYIKAEVRIGRLTLGEQPTPDR